MPAAIRSYLIAGAAWVGAGAVIAAQVITPVHVDSPAKAGDARLIQVGIRLAASVQLSGVGDGQPCSGYHTADCDIWAAPTYTPVALDTAGSAANIPANLLNAVLNMPRALIDGINDFSYALEVTGNWWVYNPTNVLGFDPADPPKITAMTNWLIPFPALSNPLGDHMAWWARANLPMDASCTGTVGPACSDIGPILSKMFLAPSWTLAGGYQFPELYNPVSDAEGVIGEEIPGSTGEKVPWSGSYVKLDPQDPINSVMNYLMADPSTNAPAALRGEEVTAAITRLAGALTLAFNPIVPMSYLLKGWPYTILTPLFLPFVPAVCPNCDPENPGGPPVPRSAAASSATVVADVADENAAAEDSAGAAALDGSAGGPETQPVRADSRQARSKAAPVENSSAAASVPGDAAESDADTTGADTTSADTTKADTTKADTTKADTIKAGTAKAGTAKAGAAEADAASDAEPEASDLKAAEEAAADADADAEAAEAPAPTERVGKHRKAEPAGEAAGTVGGRAGQSADGSDSSAGDGAASAESAA